MVDINALWILFKVRCNMSMAKTKVRFGIARSGGEWSKVSASLLHTYYSLPFPVIWNCREVQ